MIIRYEGGGAHFSGVEFDVALTLMDSAQTFQWTEHQGAFYGIIGGRAVRISQSADEISVFPCTPEQSGECIGYLDLARDYSHLRAVCAPYPHAARALDMLRGLRVLNQDPWPTLIMFILSANNNTRRIRMLTGRISEAFGQRHTVCGVTIYDLPTPRALYDAKEEALRALSCGYRAPLLRGAAKKIVEGFSLEALRGMPYEEAHKALMELPGVGPKVADCVMLFGLGHTSAFPVDVWVERLMRAWFPELCEGGATKSQISARGRCAFGENAGLIQQFLFHCARTGLIPMEREEKE